MAEMDRVSPDLAPAPLVTGPPSTDATVEPARWSTKLRQSAEVVRSTASKSADHVGAVTREHNVLAVVALVVAALGLVTYVFAPVGAIMGHIARRQIRARQQTNGGMATAAVALGWTVVAIYSLGLLCTGAFLLARGVSILNMISR